MAVLSLDLLLAACSPGGPSCLTSTTELTPAGGAHSSVAPAKFAARNTPEGVYAYEQRFVDGELRHVVIIDSKQSQLNRAEVGLQHALDDNHPLLSRLPHVALTYQRGVEVERYTDLTLPHRVYDGHIRAGSIDDQPATQHATYREVRNATPANARALLDVSPITLAYGGWDASRRNRQGRWRSALVGEIIGVCADRGAQAPTTARRGGARVDPVGMQISLGQRAMAGLANAQKGELSEKTHDSAVKAAAKAKAGEGVSASALGLGGIPPSLEQLAGVACDRVIRTHVLSLATLRQMRFAAGPDGDIACRALLAALAMTGLARADAELYLRANCDLVEASPTAVRLDQRGGRSLELDVLTIEAADELLSAALAHAESVAGVIWAGAALQVAGNPDIVAGAVDSEEGE